MVVPNHLRVRKYYSLNKNAILKKKILYAVSKTGRIPRLATVLKLDMKREVCEAFDGWISQAHTESVDYHTRRFALLLQKMP